MEKKNENAQRISRPNWEKESEKTREETNKTINRSPDWEKSENGNWRKESKAMFVGKGREKTLCWHLQGWLRREARRRATLTSPRCNISPALQLTPQHLSCLSIPPLSLLTSYWPLLTLLVSYWSGCASQSGVDVLSLIGGVWCLILVFGWWFKCFHVCIDPLCL